MKRSSQKKEEELKKAQRERDQLEIPTYHVYDRKTMPGGQGYLMYSNASSSISAVGNIFPVVLLSGSSHGDLYHDDPLCR